MGETDPNDPLETYNQQLANDIINRMPDDLQRELPPLARVIQGLHVGTNAYGERLSPKERKILKKTRDAIEKRLADQYTDGDLSELNDFLAQKGFGNQYVKKELTKRG